MLILFLFFIFTFLKKYNIISTYNLLTPHTMNKELTTPTVTVTHHTAHAEILVDYGYFKRLVRVLYPYESTDQGSIGLGSVFHGTIESVIKNAIRAELGDKTYILEGGM